MPEAKRHGITSVKAALLALKCPTGAQAGPASVIQLKLCEMELINGKGTTGMGDPRYWDCRDGKQEQLPPLKGVQMQLQSQCWPQVRTALSRGAFL